MGPLRLFLCKRRKGGREKCICHLSTQTNFPADIPFSRCYCARAFLALFFIRYLTLPLFKAQCPVNITDHTIFRRKKPEPVRIWSYYIALMMVRHEMSFIMTFPPHFCCSLAVLMDSSQHSTRLVLISGFLSAIIVLFPDQGP